LALQKKEMVHGESRTNNELAELMTQEHNISHNSRTIKLAWLFTSNAGTENGKESM